MVQTYQGPVRIYKYPFEIVMAAYEKRFPTCPQIPIFVGSDIVYEYHSEDGAEDVIERKCQLNFDAPYLLKKIASIDYIYFTQRNSLDRRKRTLLIKATNISFSNRIEVVETCQYYVHPENNDWTCFEQRGTLDIKSFYGFESLVEKLAVKQYGANIAKGKEVLEYFIEDVIQSGVTYIPPFSHSTATSSGDSAIDIPRPSDDDEEKEQLERKTSIIKRAKGQKVSFDDPEEKLEADYIRRFLGQLNPLEESRLCELKYSLSNSYKGKLPNDSHLLRFLRARDFDVSKSTEMIQKSLLWRKQHNIDKILQEFESPPDLLQYFPGCWHHHDKSGRPVFVLRLGKLDMKGCLRAFGLETMVKFTLSLIEQGLLKTVETTYKLGVPISTCTLLVDVDGLTMRHVWRPGIQALLRIIEITEAHYPETMGLVLIVRTPRIFPVLWTLISPFIDENTRKKFMVNASDSLCTELMKYIDDEYIPDFLGGKSVCELPDSGLIPKSLYKSVECVHRDDDDAVTSVYQSGVVHKNMPYEVLINVPTRGSVLTWDFDMIKGFCEFSLFATQKIVDTVPSPVSPSSHVLSSTIFSVPKAVLGKDLSIEEKSVHFCEGDSMQGSHYCSKSGTYILQWRYPESSTNQSFDFSLSQNKCKFMYYYQLLSASDFKGSVASLNSHKSSFSSLAQPSVPTSPGSLYKLHS